MSNRAYSINEEVSTSNKENLEKAINRCSSKGGLKKCFLNDENSANCGYRGKNVQIDKISRAHYYDCNHPSQYKT